MCRSHSIEENVTVDASGYYQLSEITLILVYFRTGLWQHHMDAQHAVGLTQADQLPKVEYAPCVPLPSSLGKVQDGAASSSGMLLGPAEPDRQRCNAGCKQQQAPDSSQRDLRSRHEESRQEGLPMDGSEGMGVTNQSGSGQPKRDFSESQVNKGLTTQDKVYNCGQCSQTFNSSGPFLMHACSAKEQAEYRPQVEAKCKLCKKSCGKEDKCERYQKEYGRQRATGIHSGDNQNQASSDEQQVRKAHRRITKSISTSMSKTLSWPRKKQRRKERTCSTVSRDRHVTEVPAVEKDESRSNTEASDPEETGSSHRGKQDKTKYRQFQMPPLSEALQYQKRTSGTPVERRSLFQGSTIQGGAEE